MVTVKGIYEGGDTVKLDTYFVPYSEPYEVEVAFLNPVHNSNTADADKKRKQEAFERFMGYNATLPADFDYKKELDEYREERYGYTS